MMARKGGLGLLMAAATASAMTDQPKINQARKKRLAPVEDPDLLDRWHLAHGHELHGRMRH